MEKRLPCILALVLCMLPAWGAGGAQDPDDMEGSRDPALFSRMPGFYIYDFQELEFDRYEFPIDADHTEAVEGHHLYVDYYLKEGAKRPSGLQIVRNFANAVKAIGGKTVYEYEDGGTQYVILRVAQGGTETWAAIEANGNDNYKMHVVERQAMKQDIAADAKSLAGDLNESGKAAIYGIYFDTAKADVKPESEPAIGEIVKLLQADAGLKLYVVGHTDNVGAFDYNLKLSQARAAAVVNALVAGHGVSASRLVPFGAGPTAPVASNKSEEGRAKNRRVELVAQ